MEMVDMVEVEDIYELMKRERIIGEIIGISKSLYLADSIKEKNKVIEAIKEILTNKIEELAFSDVEVRCILARNQAVKQ